MAFYLHFISKSTFSVVLFCFNFFLRLTGWNVFITRHTIDKQMYIINKKDAKI